MAKITKKNGKKEEAKKIYELFYMTPNTPTCGQIKDLLEGGSGVVQYWEAMNILQIELPGGATVDFEPMQAEFKDPSDQSFLKNRKIATVFAVTVEEAGFEAAKGYFAKLIGEYEGFFCTDSENFQPIYQLEDLQ